MSGREDARLYDSATPMVERARLIAAHSEESEIRRAALTHGGTFTIEGVYKRRTFWQWMTGAPRQLAVYTWRP